MKNLPRELAHSIRIALDAAHQAGEIAEIVSPEIVVSSSKKADQGDYSTPVAMSLAKPMGLAPRKVAEIIVRYLPALDYIERVEIAGPGFINFSLTRKFILEQVDTIIAEGDTLFTLDIGANRRAQVEFVSANPSGPITIGHTRNAVVGDAMARLLEAAGYQVEREYYFNNAGNQMIILGRSLRTRYLQAIGISAEMDEEAYRGEYLVDFAKDLAAEYGDSLKDAEWNIFKDYAEKRMFEWIKRSLSLIDIRHDHFFNENSLFDGGAVWDTLEEMRANGYIYEASEWEGASDEEKAKAAHLKPAQWFRTSRFGDDKDRVMVKSDGVPTYTLPDIAYHRDKIQRGFDIMVNVLGADHGSQHKVVRYGVEALGLNPQGIHVIIIQMVRTIRDGKEFKISKRAGIFDTLDDLVEMTSADAVRYHMLARSPNSQLTFDVDEVIKQSNENPVYYIQNAHVRCAGIFREAQARGLDDKNASLDLLGEAELRFVRKVLELGEVIETAVRNYEPHRIAFFAHELASTFHPIYDEVRALHSDVSPEVAKARLRFYRAAQIAFKRVLRLMGMTTPERM